MGFRGVSPQLLGELLLNHVKDVMLSDAFVVVEGCVVELIRRSPDIGLKRVPAEI